LHLIVNTDPKARDWAARAGFSSTSFAFAGAPRRLSLSLPGYPFLLAAALANARRAVRRFRPDVVAGFGGYISVPAGLAAAARGLPLVLHEQNAVAGLANRLLSRRAVRVATSFPRTGRLSLPPGRTVCTGLPLRPGLRPLDPADCRSQLGLDPAGFTVLVFGGSQGARALNELFLALLPRLKSERPAWQYIHLAGAAMAPAAARAYADLRLRSFVKDFWEDMPTLYGAADFVIARAGAGTVMELDALGKRALLVPYPQATDDHQAENARYLADRGGALMIRERDMSQERLWAVLKDLPDSAAIRREEEERRPVPEPDGLTPAERLALLIEQAGGARP
jgi:UDP-N-acetylglucosamine--N-acetylmuramyl-(pentapeptide) pyrophosphoryl-undecaprenol N-acetylglucosamine transferase